MRCIYCHLLLVLSYILALSQLGMCAILILINLSMSSVKEHNLAVIFICDYSYFHHLFKYAIC